MSGRLRTAWFARLKARRSVRRTLFIGYGTRILVSLVLGLGLNIDMIPGVFSVLAVEALGLEDAGYFPSLLITLIQGVLLNLMLILYMAVVQGAQFMVLGDAGWRPPGRSRGEMGTR